MLRHTVETCADDLTVLQERLDELAGDGARIISVVWQARGMDGEDQVAALDGRGSFVIIAEHAEASILRARGVAEDGAIEDTYAAARA